MNNIDATLKEVEQIAAQYGEGSWQAEKTMQMNSDPRGRYFTKIALLRKEQDEKELRILQNSKTARQLKNMTIGQTLRVHIITKRAMRPVLNISKNLG